MAAKVVFLLGCTACGKGAVGRALAKLVGGRLISTDSMKVYRRMDIGTAKPSPEARAEVPHYCIDLVEPSESFSVARFLACAEAAVEQTTSAGGVPLAVGGTGLYIKALSEGLFEGPPADGAIRAELAERARRDGLESLHEELARVDAEAAGRIHRNDERRIVRALEVFRLTGRSISQLQRQWNAGPPRYECLFIGLRRDRQDHSHRINARVKRMIDAGLADEVAGLLAEPAGLSDQAGRAVGYAEMIDHLRGRCTLEKAAERIKINTRRLARKQRTWHRRFAGVRWFDVAPAEGVSETVERIVADVGRDMR